jgi:hypothetical protein
MQFKQKTPDNNNGRKKKDRSTNNDLQNTTQKTKDPATRTNTQKWGWGGGLTCPRRVFSSCSTSGTRRVTLVEKVISHEGHNG